MTPWFQNPFVEGWTTRPLSWLLGWVWARVIAWAEEYDDLNDWEDGE